MVERRPQTVVEVGVFGGKSLFPIAQALAVIGKGVAYGVDPYSREAALEHNKDNSKIVGGIWPSLDYQQLFEDTETLIDKFGLREHCRIMRMKSEEAAASFGDNSVDFLHIDGNHSKESATLDVELWAPKTRAGSIVVMDDTNWESVRPAVQLLMSKGFVLVRDFGLWSAFVRC